MKKLKDENTEMTSELNELKQKIQRMSTMHRQVSK